ncbi:MAG: adenylate/guanylate cyclase domain-containing protein [Hyphomicrobiaceae bacterium]
MASDFDERLPEALRNLHPAPRIYAPGVRLLQRRTFDLDLRATISPLDVECWLLGAASKTASAHALTEGFASRLAQAGLGVARLSLNVGTLHPLAYGYAWNWNTLDGICDEIQIGEETLLSGEFRENPIFRVVEFGEVVRVTLLPANADARSPLMEELAVAGFSEYVAIPLSASGEKYNAVTLATQQAGGFAQAQYDTLMRLLDIFALHVERHIVSRIAHNISHTYLGRQAGERVVNGTIKRGSGLSIRAIVWSSDMRDFSRLSERHDNRTVADVLNSYFSVLAEAVIRHDGDVLKFVGDGMLAVFPLADFDSPKLAAQAAAAAAREAVRDLDALNREMALAADWEPLQTGIGLHLGDVFFGNIGATNRLDFTVIGEAVNIASRVEGLCKPLKRNVLMSAPVAAFLGERAELLGAQHLKGLQKAEQLFALLDGG